MHHQVVTASGDCEVQSQVSRFWRAWSQLAGPNMFVRSKWHTSQRNVAVGDVVWFGCLVALRGQFKLGRVVGVNPNPKAIVRDVNIKNVPCCCIPVPRPATSAPGHPPRWG